MLKHFSEILKQFTRNQRIIALLLLSITMIFLVVGSKLVYTMSPEVSDLKDTIKEYRLELRELRLEVSNLNSELRRSQRDCTDLIMQRESEIMREIYELESRIRESVRKSIPLAMVPEYNRNDSIFHSEPILIDDSQTEMILEGLKTIRQNINGNTE